MPYTGVFVRALELGQRLEHALGDARPQASAVRVARLRSEVNSAAISAHAWQPELVQLVTQERLGALGGCGEETRLQATTFFRHRSAGV
jgi:hypothetical protein